MNRTKRIEEILHKHLSNFRIDVVDNSHLHKGHNNFNGEGETHILLKLHSISKYKIKKLAIHKQINYLLKDEFDKGLHSLEIKINLLY